MPRSYRGARARLRDHFLANLGRVMGHDELRSVAGGGSAWTRRLRELRDIDGLTLLTHGSYPGLNIGEYVLTDPTLRPRGTSRLSQAQRSAVLERDHHARRMCGATQGDIHHDDPSGRRVRLIVSRINRRTGGDSSTSEDFRAVCSLCANGIRMLRRLTAYSRGEVAQALPTP